MANDIFLFDKKKDSVRVKILFLGLAIIFFLSHFFWVALESIEKNDSYSIHIANEASTNIENIFEENASILRYIGETIRSKSTEEMISYIEKYLLLTSELSIRSLTTSYISWANPEGFLIVSGKSGISKGTTKTIRNRSYYELLEKEPWILQFSNVEKSVFSTKYVLPTAMGVTLKDGRYIGALILGLRVDELYKVINHSIHKNGYEAYLFDVENNKYIPTHNTDTETIEKDINNRGYIYKKRLKNYNYEIHVEKYPLLFFIEKIIEGKFYYFITLIFLLGVYIFFIRIIRNSEELMDKLVFLRKSKNLSEISLRNRDIYYREAKIRMVNNIDDIETCLKMLNEMDFEERLYPLIKRIKDISYSLKYMRSDKIRDSKFNLNCIIDDVLAYYSNDIYDQQISINLNYEKEIPLINGDEFYLKHVLINVLGFVIENIYGIRAIFISTSINSDNDKNNIAYSLTADVSFKEGQGYVPKSLCNEVESFSTENIAIVTSKNDSALKVILDYKVGSLPDATFKTVRQKNKKGLYLVVQK